MRVSMSRLRQLHQKPKVFTCAFKVAGIDISLSNLGLSKFWLRDNSKLEEIESLLVESKPEPKKMKVRKNSDDLNRAIGHAKAIREFTEDCDMIFIELPVGSQSARAMASYGVSVGLIASLYDLPYILVLPTEVKLVTGNKLASKRDMIEWAADEFPDLDWIMGRGKTANKLVDKNEHVADSAAAVVAGIQTQEFQRARALRLRGH